MLLSHPSVVKKIESIKSLLENPYTSSCYKERRVLNIVNKLNERIYIIVLYVYHMVCGNRPNNNIHEAHI